MDDPEWLEALRRNSGLSLTRDGVWMYGGRPVENPRVQSMFHRGVAVREDGEVTLSVGRMWAYVKTDGPAFFVRAVRDLSTGTPSAGLLGEREVPLERVAAAGWGPDDRLYLWFAGLGGPRASATVAACLRDAHQALSERLEEHGAGHALELGGDRRIPLAMLAAIPSADAPPPVAGDPGESPHSEA